MLFQLGCGRQSRPNQFRYLTTLIDANFAPQRSKFPDPAPLKTHQAFGVAMEVGTASRPPRLVVRLHAIADRRDSNHRKLIIALHTSETGAHRLMT
jgi:hypothetical protein